ncbi:hypothetical protein PLICRDRAFT_176408 [Plicaturopsis crispa FD-325 SS-3]|nr:hypothetical protein PLICRDRAFT_176408 [Plicaturopsis crispa FD-325 SS-3]
MYAKATSATTPTFVTALVFNAIVFGAELVAFTILRRYFKSVYEARTLSLVSRKRVQPIGGSLLTWPWMVLKANYQDIAKVNGLDAYFFVRFLRMMTRILLPMWVISWIVLLPITAIGTSNGDSTGLDKYSYGNVGQDDGTRLWAHLVLTWVFTIWIWWNIKREMRHFTIKRQQHLISPEHSSSVQANTVLLTGIPQRFLNEPALRRMYNHLPGGVKTVWLNRDLKELPDLYDRREAACRKLESAETSLLATAAKLRANDAKKNATNGEAAAEPTPAVASDVERGDTSRAASLVPAADRPTHRLPLGFLPFALPLIGKKVDSIEWAREEIATTNGLLEKGRATIEAQATHGLDAKKGLLGRVPVVGGKFAGNSTSKANPFDKQDVEVDQKRNAENIEMSPTGSSETDRPPIGQDYPPMNSAFLTFHKQAAAHLAVQALAHHEPYRMSSRYVEVAPEDVIWGNLGLNPYEAKGRMLVSYAATAGLIILWSFPVAFVGAVSNVAALCTQYHWLSWICALPDVVVGIIAGILPPVLLAVLMMLLPIVLRLLGRFEGIPQRTGLELSLMSRFFIFQVIHSFLIVTLSSGIIKALPELTKNPAGIPALLANKLPGASIFFLTYIVLQGLSGTAGGFLQIVTLILYYVKLYILGSTPRSIYNIKFGGRSVAWGTLFPTTTLLVVITLGYSTIAPIINGLACFTFFLFYLLYKYLFLWVLDQPPSSDTGGLFFPKALQHVFVGLYVQQVCLCALFFLAQDSNGHASAIPEGALMVVLIVFTAFYQMMIHNSYGPLIHFLPLSLADRTYGGGEGDEQPQPQMDGPSEKGKAASPIADDDTESQSRAPLVSKGQISNDYGFAQPAASRPQPIVWFPRDTLGLAEEEVAANRAAGIDVSLEGAEMSEKGKVQIAGAPPGLETTS